MDKAKMLEDMVQYYANGNKTQFAKMLGVTPQGISTWIARKTFDTELVFAKCERISPVWLLTGEGEMIDDSVTAREGGEIDYAKVMHLCQVLLENYKQRDCIIGELLKLLTK